MAQRVKNQPANGETQEMWVLSLGRKDPWREKRRPTPVFLPEKSHGQRSLEGYSPVGCKVRHNWTTEIRTIYFIKKNELDVNGIENNNIRKWMTNIPFCTLSLTFPFISCATWWLEKTVKKWRNNITIHMYNFKLISKHLKLFFTHLSHIFKIGLGLMCGDWDTEVLRVKWDVSPVFFFLIFKN